MRATVARALYRIDDTPDSCPTSLGGDGTARHSVLEYTAPEHGIGVAGRACEERSTAAK